MNHSPLQLPRPGRRSLLLGAGLAAAGGTLGLARPASAAAAPGAPGAPAVLRQDVVAPADALQRLKDGNDRFARGAMTHPRQDPATRAALASAQHPFAVVLTCLDSRVPPEIVFDQGLGDLLVIRGAAHALDTLVVGGGEYGQAETAAPLIVVLGHQRCTEVAAAVQSMEKGTDPGPHLDEVVNSLRPAYEAAKGIGATDLAEATAREQVALSVQILKADARFAGAQHDGTLTVVGAYYGLDDGRVAWF